MLDRPYDDVARLVEACPEGVLEGSGPKPAGPGRWPARLVEAVDVRAGPVHRHASSIVVGVSWRPKRNAGALPALEADLELRPCGASETALVLRGHYVSTAEAAETSGLVRHHVAEATARSLLGYVAGRLARAPQPAAVGGRAR